MGSVRLLKASAGSGKTFRLAYEYIRAIIREPMQYRHILAVTFTNKATDEMKDRIISELDMLARGEPTLYSGMLREELGLDSHRVRERALEARTLILHDYSRFAVLTIDKFFQRIIRSFIRELGIDLNFTLELQTDSLLTTAADKLIDGIAGNPQLKAWITAFVEERIEENKKWDIRGGLTELGTELFRESYRSMSKQGSGKEELTAIADRISSRAHSIVAVARQKAQQALDLIAKNGLSTSDFSGGTRSFANYFIKVSRGELPAYGQSVANALGSDEKWCSKSSPRKERIMTLVPELKEMLCSICSLYDKESRFLNSAALFTRNYRNFAMLTDLQEKVREICSQENLLPISETTEILYKLISGNDTPFIFEKSGSYFSRFMIDEFQDTSLRQWENFLPLLGNSLSQTEDSPVVLVGDVKQSIYRWRGGDWRILSSGVASRFDQLKSEVLDTNYRSLSNIVEFNNALISGFVGSVNEKLDAELREACENGLIPASTVAELEGTVRTAYRDHTQNTAGGTGGYITVCDYGPDGDTDECIPPVIARIEDLQRRGYRPGDIAVLVRYNADGIKIADMLLRHKRENAGSPYSYDVVTQEALSISSSETVGFVVACMKLAVRENEKIYLAVYNNFKENPVDQEPAEEEKRFLSELSLLPPAEAFENIVRYYRLGSSGMDTAYLQALHDQIIAFQKSRIGDIPLFLRWWEESGVRQSVKVPHDGNAITISSIHKAKGLEYPAVIIPYCDWTLAPGNRTVVWVTNNSLNGGTEGKFPLYFSEKMKNSHFAEEYYRELVMSYVDNLNTFYVAVTRAREELHIMVPAGKTRRSERVSTYLENIIDRQSSGVSIGNLSGVLQETEKYKTYNFGLPSRKEGHERRTVPGSMAFRSFSSRDRLKLRLDHSRYFEEEVSQGLMSPRDKGLLLHRIFENSGAFDDIARQLASLRVDGEISAEEAESMEATLSKVYQNPIVRSWFGGDWHEVRNENEILLPGVISGRRPDRVMIKDGKVVIVDYKFGLKRSPAHRRQMREYMDILDRMGYREIEGYVWYVSLDDIEEVSRS